MDNFSIASLNIKDIIETNCPNESKNLVKKGWHLLNCYTKGDSNIYVLGLPSIITAKEAIEAYELI